MVPSPPLLLPPPQAKVVGGAGGGSGEVDRGTSGATPTLTRLLPSIDIDAAVEGCQTLGGNGSKAQPHATYSGGQGPGSTSGVRDGRLGVSVKIKGGKAYRESESFHFSRLRVDDCWQHMLFVGRRKDPMDWTDVAQLDALFTLGHLSRENFEIALSKAGPLPRINGNEVTASMTVGSKRHSWLGPYVEWVRFDQLDRACLHAHLGR